MIPSLPNRSTRDHCNYHYRKKITSETSPSWLVGSPGIDERWNQIHRLLPELWRSVPTSYTRSFDPCTLAKALHPWNQFLYRKTKGSTFMKHTMKHKEKTIRGLPSEHPRDKSPPKPTQIYDATRRWEQPEMSPFTNPDLQPTEELNSRSTLYYGSETNWTGGGAIGATTRRSTDDQTSSSLSSSLFCFLSRHRRMFFLRWSSFFFFFWNEPFSLTYMPQYKIVKELFSPCCNSNF